MRKALVAAVAALFLLAPSAQAQQAGDAARGSATQLLGPGETVTYELEAVAGPTGASGLINRSFVSPTLQSIAVADVTCVAAQGNRATVIGRIRPDESVNVGYEALLLQIYDGTPEAQVDAVLAATDPKVNGMTTFTECAQFLPPFPFTPDPITAGDFQVVDVPGGPPPPEECDEDDQGQDNDDQGEGDCENDDG